MVIGWNAGCCFVALFKGCFSINPDKDEGKFRFSLFHYLRASPSGPATIPED
jgi:hypothetical protein